MLDGSPLLRAAFAGLALIVALALLTWLASLARRDVSLVDRAWSLFIAGAALVYFVLLPAPGPRGAWLVALALAWALRLSLYITARNWGHGEDRRYQAIRARNLPNFAVKSLVLVFALQAVLAWLVSAPFFAGMAGTGALGGLDAAGLALAAFGIVFEAVADAQMARFKGDAANRGQVMDRGLWRYSRHPNYFGDALAWWGFALFGVASGAPFTVLGPILMTYLLLKVSGVALLEKTIAERRPQYADYIARTSAFIPWPPLKSMDRRPGLQDPRARG